MKNNNFSLFSDSLFMFSHSIILESSSLIKVCVSTLLCLLLNVFMVLDKVVSSAYIIKSNFLVDSEKSFIYMINNKGPRIEPCGTPIFKGKISDFYLQFPYIVSCFLSNFQIVSEWNVYLKPYWLGKEIPYSSKYDDNCLCIIFSITFEIVGRKEIGL